MSTTPAGDELLDVIVVGESQAGLAMAWYLARQHLRFVVLEAGPKVGHTWRSRWDSLKLFTPRPVRRLARHALPWSSRYLPRQGRGGRLSSGLRGRLDLPVRLNARVTRLSRTEDGFEATTGDGVFRARQVVVATGPLELAATRQVDLSVSTRSPVLPQRPGGQDLFWWLTRLGLIRVTAQSRPGRRMSSREFVVGSSRRGLQAAGVRYRPAVDSADGDAVRFADGTSLDAGVVIWATGYRSDYAWIDIPGVAHDGKVVHQRGVTKVPGLYFLGLY